MDKFQFIGLLVICVGGGALDAPAAQYYDFALVSGELVHDTAGRLIIAPTLIIGRLCDKYQFENILQFHHNL